MAVPSNYNFTTGPATLPDVGQLNYNGCVFSPLFETSLSGKDVLDEAKRTIKYVEYTLIVDGYVTLGSGLTNIAPTMALLQDRLNKKAGYLIYRGRGCDFAVNAPGVPNGVQDVAFGPEPEVLEFQPLGGGLSAKVRWRVKFSLPGLAGLGITIHGVAFRLLQLNYESSVTYSEDGYSSLAMRGTLEIPLTRPTQGTRTLTTTADDFRIVLTRRILAGIDLDRFKVTKRDFNLSRDKRTLTWEFAAEERPYMDLPPDCPIARGTFSFKPARVGMGLCLWLCTLRGTYTVRKDRPRRTAWVWFLALLRQRMRASERPPVGFANIPPANGGQQVQNPQDVLGIGQNVLGQVGQLGQQILNNALNPQQGMLNFGRQLLRNALNGGRCGFLIDFSGDEGIYGDSKTISFSATWRLVTTFSHILLASGLWRKLPERDASNRNLWAISMRNVQGVESWLPNRHDPSLDVIVDFGFTDN